MHIKDFYQVPVNKRAAMLENAVLDAHSFHYENNTAYRSALAARGVDRGISKQDFARLLRPAALTFKGYIDRIGLFAEKDPAGLVAWLREQISMPLPDRMGSLRRQYPSFEALLSDLERIYADLGMEFVTSSGTSGRASIVPRNAETIAGSVNAFFTSIQRAWDIRQGMALIFMMPYDTRVALARTARFGTRELDWASSSPVYYTMPFNATPDRIRIRAGRSFKPGLQGLIERRVLHPFLGWANEHLADPRILKHTQQRLEQCAGEKRPLLLLGGLVQLHGLVQHLQMELPPGSRVATGGGMKEMYPFTPEQIRADLRAAFPGTPVSDVYGMAEANWAAFECPQGNYHIPPWVYAVATDDNDRILPGPDVSGLLAYYDPIGGGNLIPPFFQTADHVRLINGGDSCSPERICPCGEDTAYILGRIQRVDLMEEAGCAGQI